MDTSAHLSMEQKHVKSGIQKSLKQRVSLTMTFRFSKEKAEDMLMN